MAFKLEDLSVGLPSVIKWGLPIGAGVGTYWVTRPFAKTISYSLFSPYRHRIFLTPHQASLMSRELFGRHIPESRLGRLFALSTPEYYRRLRWAESLGRAIPIVAGGLIGGYLLSKTLDWDRLLRHWDPAGLTRLFSKDRR